MARKTNTSKGERAPLRRVLVVVNKWWEFEPVMNVLLNDNARPAKKLGWPTLTNYPCERAILPEEYKNKPPPRAVFNLNNVLGEIWCISDLLAIYDEASHLQSSSEKKMDRLNLMFGDGKPSLTISVGTAAYPSDESKNGSVVVGSKVFMHNGHPNGTNPYSNWQEGPFDEVIDSTLSEEDFEAITAFNAAEVTKLFLSPPLNPDVSGGELIINYENVALCTVNVTDYGEYEAKDRDTLEAYKKAVSRREDRSLETTHGIVRAAASGIPFLFISGIVDRVGFFSEDVTPKEYAQNMVGAHNAGIVVARVLPNVDSLLG